MDLLSETELQLKELANKGEKKTKNFTAKEHLKFSDQARALSRELSGPLIEQLQTEALEQTFLSNQEGTPKRKVGRPRKVQTPTPPSTPNRANTPPQSRINSAKAVSTDEGMTSSGKGTGWFSSTGLFKKNRATRIRQIKGLCRLYERLLVYELGIPVNNLHACSDAELENMYDFIKKEIANGNAIGKGFEYESLKQGFLGIVGYFEIIAQHLVISMGGPERAPYILTKLARNPPGTFASYIEACNTIADKSIEPELQEISIDLMGFMPTNVYARLILKVFYRLYDFYRFDSDKYIQTVASNLQSFVPTEQVSPEQSEKLRSILRKQRSQAQ